MSYARDPYDTDEPPCFCDQEAGPVLTTREFCPAHGDPDKPALEPPDDGTPALGPIHVCSYCGHVCSGDGNDEHVCGDDVCVSIHLPAPSSFGTITESGRAEQWATSRTMRYS